MKKYTEYALQTAQKLNAQYCDIRIIQLRKENLRVQNGSLFGPVRSESLGFGIRVMAQGAWGFAASAALENKNITDTVKRAHELALAAATVQTEPVQWAAEPAYRDNWQSAFLKDPFQVPFGEKTGLLLAIDAVLRSDHRIVLAHGAMDFQREHQWFANSEGAFIEQDMLRSGAGYSATARNETDMQRRSYPGSFGGQFMQSGYELIDSLQLLDHAPRVRDEAIALLSAKPCPTGKKDIIIHSDQLALQIHESIGHPSELDRVLGHEANYAGRSFITLDKYQDYPYGSKHMNIVADATQPGGLATFGYDDDGVRAQRWPIIQEGRYQMYLTNRELAHMAGERRSRGCNRADGFHHLPMIRMVNISLSPGNIPFDDLVRDIEDGILFDTIKAWSIDQMRLNFQFTTEVGWEIKQGKLGAMIKNPTYHGITPEFWHSLDGVADLDSYVLWGIPNCGKGQPGQRAEMSHGGSPARFRDVDVGYRAAGTMAPGSM